MPVSLKRSARDEQLDMQRSSHLLFLFTRIVCRPAVFCTDNLEISFEKCKIHTCFFIEKCNFHTPKSFEKCNFQASKNIEKCKLLHIIILDTIGYIKSMEICEIYHFFRTTIMYLQAKFLGMETYW